MTGHPAAIHWDLSVDPAASDTINRWSRRLRNAQPAFNEMADFVADSQKDWFATSGNGTWAPLSPKYAAWKRKRFPKRGILHGPDRPGHRGLQLRDQLTRRPFGYERITPRSMTIGTTLPYARLHHQGAGPLPKREPIKPLDQRTYRILQHILQVHVVGETIGG